MCYKTLTTEVPQTVEMARGGRSIIPIQDDPYVRLQKLKDLLDAGVLSEKEFNEKKSKILETI